MYKPRSCQQIQELMPFLVNASVSEEEATIVVQHLEICDVCKKLFDIERPMFMAALDSSNPRSPLSEHPEAEHLHDYVRRSFALGQEELTFIRQHLVDCAMCRDEVKLLESLPLDASELLNENSAPFLTSLDRYLERKKRAVNRTGMIEKIVWNPIMGYAVAAVLIAILLFRSEKQPTIIEKTTVEKVPYAAAMINANFPSATRGALDTVAFATPTSSSYLNIRCYVGPEEGHTYSLYLTDKISGRTIKALDRLAEFDQHGFADFTLLTDTGSYQLTVYDIFGSDTVVVNQNFVLRLRPTQ